MILREERIPNKQARNVEIANKIITFSSAFCDIDHQHKKILAKTRIEFMSKHLQFILSLDAV